MLCELDTNKEFVEMDWIFKFKLDLLILKIFSELSIKSRNHNVNIEINSMRIYACIYALFKLVTNK